MNQRPLQSINQLAAMPVDELLRRDVNELVALIVQQREALHEKSSIIEQLQGVIVARESELERVNTDYQTLTEASQRLLADRNSLAQKVSELQAANHKLTDMLWGRGSERRTFSPQTPILPNFPIEALNQPNLTLPKDVVDPLDKAQEEFDKAKLRELEKARLARIERMKNRKREEFPETLERRTKVIDLPEEEKAGLKLLRVEIVESLRFESPKQYVLRTERPLYVKDSQSVIEVLADAPSGTEVVGVDPPGVISMKPELAIVPGCKYGFCIISAITAMKFGFHNPTYRQQDYFGQFGWSIPRSTINDLIWRVADTIDPLFLQMQELIMSQRIVLGDATKITVLLPDELDQEIEETLGRRQKNRDLKKPLIDGSQPNQPDRDQKHRSATSYAWLYSGLEAPRTVSWSPDQPTATESPPGAHSPPYHPPDFSEARWRYAPYDIFYWSLTQENSVVDSHLAAFRGTFVGDAAGGYARLSNRSGGRIEHSACNAHARREFIDAEKNDPVLASRIESYYRQLYAVEFRAKEMTPADRLALRQRDSVPVWERLERCLDEDAVKRVLPSSRIGKAVQYLRNHWEALRRYLWDGELPIDNNQSERTIRPLSIGRKNWLFLGSLVAAPGRMKIFSVVSSAQRHGLLLQPYLEDILSKLAEAKQYHPSDLELGSEYLMNLLPDRWAAMHPEHVNRSRLEERQQVAERKQMARLEAGLRGQHPYGAKSVAPPSPETATPTHANGCVPA